MHKLLAFAIGLVAALSGCSATQKTQTWATVKAVRHPQPGIPDRARAFAGELHTTLAHSGVEHKIVTFTFRYSGKYDMNRLAESTAVIYRDSGTPAHPWWLIDEDLSNPLWLPTESPQCQIGFRLHRPATIVKVEEFPFETARTEEPRRESHKRRAALRKRPTDPIPIKPTRPDTPPAPPKP
jgi:hypothetical protein